MNLGYRSLKFHIAVTAVIALSAILGTTCDRNGDESATETPTSVASALTSSQTAPPTESPTPAPLKGAEIYSRISPYVPRITTGGGAGSGVLIDGGFVVTNAHVVWGFNSVKVSFPNGIDHWSVPVVGLDLMADIAVIGPIDTTPTGLTLQNGEGLAIGSDLYLVGYPDEGGLSTDKPTITRGVLSRFRQWRTLGLTLIQSDAVTAGGQSGGVMVSENGEVIGITTKTFGDGEFVIATSAEDIREHVNGLIEGKDVDGLGDRRLPASRGQSKQRFGLTDRWDSKIAVLYEPPNTEIDIRLEGETDSSFDIVDVFAEVILEIDATEAGVESGSTNLETFGPHFVRFRQFSSEPAEFALETSHNLVFINDRDDHRRVSVDESVVGNVDAPFDEDYLELQLDAGESVTISVESFMINPYVRVARADWNRAAVEDDNSGVGVIGQDAHLSFTAPESGTYIILVSDSWDNAVGGYFLKVDGAARRAVSPPPTETLAIPAVPSPHGLMATYANAEYDFSIQYPADWTESKPDDGYATRLESGDGGFLTINIEELTAAETDDSALDDFVDRLVSWIESAEQGGRVHTHAEYGYVGGKPAQLVSYTLGGFDGARLSFFSEQGIAFVVAYEFHEPPTDEVARMVEYSFGTLTVEGQQLTRLTDVPEFPRIETDTPDSPAAAPEAAPEPIWFVPMTTYRDQESRVSIQYPSDWERVGDASATAVFIDDNSPRFLIQIRIDSLPDGASFDELTDTWRSQFDSSSAHRIISSTRFGEINGLPTQLLVYDAPEGSQLGFALLYVSEDGATFQIFFVTDAANFNELAPVLEYSFRSISVDGNPLTDAPDFPFFERALAGSTVPSTESARARGRFMPMLTYGSQEYPFTIQYPAEWEAFDGGDPWTAQFSSYEGDALLLSFVDPRNAERGDLTLDEQVDDLLSIIDSEDIDHQVLSTSRFGQIAGLPAHLVVLIDHETDSLQTHLLHVDKGGVLYQILFLLDTSGIEDLLQTLELEDFLQTVQYSLRSVTVGGNPLTDAPEFPSLDAASPDEAQTTPESALIQSPFGPMAIYRDEEFVFTMQYPAGWRASLDSGAFDASFSNYDGGGLSVAITDGRNTEISNMNMDTYSNSVITRYISANDGAQVASNVDYGRIDERMAQLIVFDDPTKTVATFLYISEDSVIYTIILIALAPQFDDLAPLFEHMLNSITINGKSLLNPPEFPRVE